jgi:hypothetical protein
MNVNINTQEIGITLQAGIQAMFWGAVVTAIAIPIAGAMGTKIAGKIAGTKRDNRYA